MIIAPDNDLSLWTNLSIIQCLPLVKHKRVSAQVHVGRGSRVEPDLFGLQCLLRTWTFFGPCSLRTFQDSKQRFSSSCASVHELIRFVNAAGDVQLSVHITFHF